MAKNHPTPKNSTGCDFRKNQFTPASPKRNKTEKSVLRGFRID